MKKIIIILTGFIWLLFTGMSVEASCPVRECGGQSSCNSVCNILYKDKNVLYNALNLTCEQAKCKEELETKKMQEMQNVLPELYSAQDCLKRLETANAPNREIKKQRKVVKKIEKKIDNIEKSYEKEFKKHLTSVQKSKYHEIERLQKREIKKCEKCECRKLPEGMRPFAPGFGTNQQQNCSCGKKNCHCNK